MNMIERVARAISKVEGWNADDTTDVGFKIEGIPVWKSYEPAARAAIEAMREPTPEMVYRADHCAGLDENGNWNNPEPPQSWQAMIDAALK